MALIVSAQECLILNVHVSSQAGNAFQVFNILIPEFFCFDGPCCLSDLTHGHLLYPTLKIRSDQ